MSKPIDFALDYETLGKAPHGATVDLAIIPFVDDPYNPPTFQELIQSALHIKFNLADQKQTGSYPRYFDADTIAWWKKQSEEARAGLKPLPTDIGIKEGIEKVAEFLEKSGVKPRNSLGYSRGNSFDFSIMTDQLRQVYGNTQEAFDKEWCAFWNQRDLRTAIENTLMSRHMTECPLPAGTLDGFIAHTSIHDVAKDILMLIYAKRYALGLEDCPTEETADPHSLKKNRA